MEKYRVIFHLDECAGNRCLLVLNNMKNLIGDMGAEQVAIELLANGEGVIMLLKSPGQYVDKVAQLAAQGVQFKACAHALQHAGINPGELLDVVEVVPSGVGELVKKQAAGWLYIRP
ncbi:hypothetical protein SCACP_40790 [Sporomusa carbonis]|uniref:DsrE family protein n=1 Tax=Sporomusa carbonis TaxID=3076075 RepID=UPI003A6F8099